MYFKFNISTNECVCQIPDCVNPIRTGSHSGNLENHVKVFHKDEYLLLLKEKERLTGSKLKRDGCFNSTVSKKQKVGPLDNMIIVTKKTLSNVSLSKQKLIEACVQLVTINGRPFTLMEDSGFKMIIDPLLDAIGGDFRINSRNIRNHVKEHAYDIVKNIKLDVYKRLVSLKVDCVTRLNRSIIGVNVQYIKDDKLNIKTLGMTELSEKHTSEYLKKVLINILKKYDIDNRQVYSITCDNGRNIVKMVKIFNDANDDDILNEDDIEADIESENTEHLRNDGHDILSESTIEDIITDTEIDLNDDNNLQQEVYSALEIENEEYLTQSVRCSEHTFQLCLEQDFKITSVNNTVVKARKVNSLEPAYFATKRLQKKDLTLGDFFGIWQQTKSKFQQINSLLSNSIVQSMNSREEQLMDNSIFVAAIYLDPRFMCTLTAAKKQIAIDHLIKTWTLKESISGNQNLNENLAGSTDESVIDIDEQICDNEDPFEEFLAGCSHTSSQNRSLNESNESQSLLSSKQLMREKIEEFGRVERLTYKADVINYWKDNKIAKPELFELAQILMAVPATQVSVERSFSALKFILSDLRSSISSDILEDILIIRGNNQ
ncbi:hypothetical protein ACI65C_001177 [Semiaphis heraclei]